MLWLLLLAWSIGRGPGGPGQRRQGRPSCGGCRGLEQLGNLFSETASSRASQSRDEYRIHCFGHETVG
jgi:hypothetical protein